jgi:lactate dehydrogenase-like 2-hydroxyacid dehydrogenase
LQTLLRSEVLFPPHLAFAIYKAMDKAMEKVRENIRDTVKDKGVLIEANFRDKIKIERK